MKQIEFSLLPKQIQYLNSQADTAIYHGGVGASKTIADVCLAIDYALTYPGIKILMTAPTYGNLKDTVIAEFQEHCPPEILEKQIWGIYPEVRFIKIKGRQSKIIFRSFDKPWKPKGITAGLWIGGELSDTPEKTHNELRRRIRQRGMPNHKRYTTNPDSKQHWIYKRFIGPFERGETTDLECIATTSFDNYMLPENYLADLRRLEQNLPGEYRRMVLGEWGDFDEDTIGAFQLVPKFTSPYLVAFIDTSYSNSSVSDRTAVSIVGFVPQDKWAETFWPIEFTGKSWQKSITHPEVINDLLRFLDQFQPIETCLESQLGDSTQIFIDRFKQAEKELGIKTRNQWTVFHQTKNKHERIMLHVGANKNRMKVLEGTDADYLNPIIGYTKKAEHDDEIDSLAGGVHLWQNSRFLRDFILAQGMAKRLGIAV